MFSGPVLTVAAFLVSSALWQAFVDETLTPEVAITRYLVAVGVTWLALSAVVSLVGPAPSASPPRSEAADDAPTLVDQPAVGAAGGEQPAVRADAA